MVFTYDRNITLSFGSEGIRIKSIEVWQERWRGIILMNWQERTSCQYQTLKEWDILYKA